MGALFFLSSSDDKKLQKKLLRKVIFNSIELCVGSAATFLHRGMFID